MKARQTNGVCAGAHASRWWIRPGTGQQVALRAWLSYPNDDAVAIDRAMRVLLVFPSGRHLNRRHHPARRHRRLRRGPKTPGANLSGRAPFNSELAGI
jgi:hypothetical protein